MSGKTDHILFPKSRVAIVTGNYFLPFTEGEKIDMHTLYTNIPHDIDMEKRFSLAAEIIPLAQSCVRKAKMLHDDLEKYYIGAMDFSGMDSLFGRILQHFYHQFPQNC